MVCRVQKPPASASWDCSGGNAITKPGHGRTPRYAPSASTSSTTETAASRAISTYNRSSIRPQRYRTRREVWLAPSTRRRADGSCPLARTVNGTGYLLEPRVQALRVSLRACDPPLRRRRPREPREAENFGPLRVDEQRRDAEAAGRGPSRNVRDRRTPFRYAYATRPCGQTQAAPRSSPRA